MITNKNALKKKSKKNQNIKISKIFNKIFLMEKMKLDEEEKQA